jgi:hypothetical protein
LTFIPGVGVRMQLGADTLALDLHHADAAIAVGTVSGLGRIAQMRQLDAVAARGAEDRLALGRFDLAAIEGEANAIFALAVARAHSFTLRHQPPSGLPRSSGK